MLQIRDQTQELISSFNADAAFLDELLQSETYASTQELKVGVDSLKMDSINALSQFTQPHEGGVQDFGV